MRRKYLVFSAAAICVYAVVTVLLFRFFPARNWGSLTAKRAPINAHSPVAPKRLVTIRAPAPVVPLPFSRLPRGASAAAQGKPATQADAAHDRFARWAEVYFSASTSSEKAALSAQGKELAAARREALA